MLFKVNEKWKSYLKPIWGFKEIIWFVILFIVFDIAWKGFVHEGANENIMLVFGQDTTSYLDGLCVWTAQATYWVVHTLWGNPDFRIEGTILYFPDSLKINIIWSCTSLKQFFQFAFILFFYFGPKSKKLWYIPFSIFILAIVNILRLALICLLMKGGFPEWFISFNEFYNSRKWDGSVRMYWTFYRDWFQLFHRDIFAWLYYDGVIFVLWLIWEEKFNKPYRRLRDSEQIDKNKQVDS